MINEPFYEARISVPGLEYRIQSLVREALPEVEEKLLKELVRACFSEETLKVNVSKQVKAVFDEQVRLTAFKILRNEFADDLEATIRFQIAKALGVEE